jgi:hypothetical protein
MGMGNGRYPSLTVHRAALPRTLKPEPIRGRYASGNVIPGGALVQEASPVAPRWHHATQLQATSDVFGWNLIGHHVPGTEEIALPHDDATLADPLGGSSLSLVA